MLPERLVKVVREPADGRLVANVRPPEPARRKPADVPAKFGDDGPFPQPLRRASRAHPARGRTKNEHVSFDDLRLRRSDQEEREKEKPEGFHGMSVVAERLRSSAPRTGKRAAHGT